MRSSPAASRWRYHLRLTGYPILCGTTFGDLGFPLPNECGGNVVSSVLCWWLTCRIVAVFQEGSVRNTQGWEGDKSGWERNLGHFLLQSAGGFGQPIDA